MSGMLGRETESRRPLRELGIRFQRSSTVRPTGARNSAAKSKPTLRGAEESVAQARFKNRWYRFIFTLCPC